MPKWLGERPCRQLFVSLVTTTIVVTVFTLVLWGRDAWSWAVPVIGVPLCIAFAESRCLNRWSRVRIFVELALATNLGILAASILSGEENDVQTWLIILLGCSVLSALATVVAALLISLIASFRRRRHPLYAWLLEPLEILSDLVVPDQIVMRLWRRDRSYVSGFVSVVAWLGLFLLGTYVATAEYRSTLMAGPFGGSWSEFAWAIVVVMVCYTPINTAILSCLGGYLGVLTQRFIAEASSREQHRNILWTLYVVLFRGLLVYGLVVSAVAVFSLDSVVAADQGEYLALALVTTFLSFLSGQFSGSPSHRRRSVDGVGAMSAE